MPYCGRSLYGAKPSPLIVTYVWRPANHAQAKLMRLVRELRDEASEVASLRQFADETRELVARANARVDEVIEQNILKDRNIALVKNELETACAADGKNQRAFLHEVEELRAANQRLAWTPSTAEVQTMTDFVMAREERPPSEHSFHAPRESDVDVPRSSPSRSFATPSF